MTTLPASIKSELVQCHLKAETKEEALREMVQLLASEEPSIVIDEILQALDERERQGPFSIAKGVAFPHARTEGVRDFTIVIGTKPSGLDFRTRDGQSVQIIILFVIPKKHSNLYLRTLAWFLNFFQEEPRTERVATRATPEDVISTLSGQNTWTQPGIFNTCAVTITKETSLRSTLTLMAKNRLDAVPVVENGREFVGEVTLKSLLRSELLDGKEPLEDLLKNGGDSSIESHVTTDSYLPVGDCQSVFSLTKELAAKGLHRAYQVRDRRLCGIAILPDLLYRCWKKE